MRKRLSLLLLVFLVLGCAKKETKRAQDQPFNAAKFIVTAAQLARSEVELAKMAAKKGRLPETRQLGSKLQQDQAALYNDLFALAQKKRLTVPDGVDPTRKALKDNLEILPGQVFDRGYSLAMVQDFNTLIYNFQRAAQSGDRDLVALSRKQLPLLNQRLKSSNAVLDRVGGSPFGAAPVTRPAPLDR